MPSWGEIFKQLQSAEHPVTTMRKKYLNIMHQYTRRNIIAYYSAFLQKQRINGLGIDDNDKNAFMQAMCGLERSKGLDLILHTPGGEIAATESLVYYLKKMFDKDIRVFVPQIAMSAGTMIAISSKEIIMGKQSNLGPIDPQYGGFSCAGIVDEFKKAVEDVAKEPRSQPFWGAIIGKYHPTFIGECAKAIQWSEEIAQKWLVENMFSDFTPEVQKEKVKKVLDTLASHDATYSHSKHIHADELIGLGLKVSSLEGLNDSPKEDCKDLQDCVLTLHHSYMHTLSSTGTIKIVENHIGEAMIVNAKQ